MLNMGMTNYQMLDDNPKCLTVGICEQNDPYRLKPYVNFNGNWQSKESNINFNVDSEIVFFDHLQSESGKRLKNRTTLSKIFNLKGIEVQPHWDLIMQNLSLIPMKQKPKEHCPSIVWI